VTAAATRFNVHAASPGRTANQAEELFVALRLLGRGPVLVRFPAESHELSRSGAPRHRVERAEIILDWFKERLMGAEQA